MSVLFVAVLVVARICFASECSLAEASAREAPVLYIIATRRARAGTQPTLREAHADLCHGLVLEPGR
jgi:hypothetical protein